MSRLPKVEIKERKEDLGDGEFFYMYDPVINGEVQEMGKEPISNNHFWGKMEEATQRAKFRLKKNNPNLNLNANIFAPSPEQADKNFINHLEEKNPGVDVNAILEIFEEELKDIKQTGPDDDHPNPFIKFPVDSHLVKNIAVNVAVKYADKLKDIS